MATVTYPDIKQCEGTSRDEVTVVLTDVSDNGVIRGRTMDDTSTYELTLFHTALDRDTWEMFDAWWQANKRNEMLVTWAVDEQVYRGVPKDAPAIQYVNSRFDVQMTLLVKRDG